MPLIFSQQPRDGAHGLVDVVGTGSAGKAFELLQNIIPILIRQRRNANLVSNRPMTRLARSNPAFPIAKRDQPRCDRRTSRLRLPLRKHTIILRVAKERQRREIRNHIRGVARRKRFRNRLHHTRSPLMSSKIFQLLPDRKCIQASQIRSRSHWTESLRAMAVIAALSQQHPSKRISGGSRRDIFRRPRHQRGNPYGRRITGHQNKRAQGQGNSTDRQEMPLPYVTSPISLHSCPSRPASRKGTDRAAPLSTPTAWHSVRRRKIPGRPFCILPRA